MNGLDLGRLQRWGRRTLLAVLVVTLLAGSGACRRNNSSDAAVDTETEASDEPTQDLTFNNITLEQSDDAGALIWRMEANQAIYSQDRQDARIESPTGEFYRNGEPAFEIEAESGEVRQNGEQLFLRGKVTATDLETGAVLRGDELEWVPEGDLFIVRNNVKGTHPDFILTANRVRASLDAQRIEVEGDVRARSTDGTFRLEAEELVWLIEEELLTSDRPLQIQQRQGRQVTGQANSDQAEFNLATEVAILQKNAVVNLDEPPIRVTGDSLQWNLADNTVLADQPLTVVHRGERMTLNANQGEGNLDDQVFRMTGSVRVVAEQNQARLNSDRLTWKIPTQDVVAEGNVRYRQVDPVAELQGSRAVGKLQNETIVVTGQQVVTEIIPNNTN